VAFVVEDGTGLSNATSLIAVATAVTFWTDRDPSGTGAAFLALATSDQQLCCVRASDYLRNARRYSHWSGQKLSYAQRMPFPRTGAYERYGQAVPSTVVPWQVADAVCYLAPLALAGPLEGVLAHGGYITQESVGTLHVSYGPKATVESVIQFVDGILLSLLRPDVVLAPVTYEDPDIPDAYTDLRFEDQT
jgi:hypothetical protein